MTTSPDVNFEELARSTDEFNGAQLKAVCVEAGMIALREGATKLGHEHFLSGIAEGEASLYLRSRLRLELMYKFAACSAKQEEERSGLLCLIFLFSLQVLNHDRQLISVIQPFAAIPIE